ncbi:hypothetical protein [uncultured Clostridium sp.]|uniref:hypothetical protein n=1 Tax=uncultured Clostridium sp. TaxID=59620 RepID=UPI0025E9A36C|nr:hypothetical protein [uncultured Clostridium sp.]
MNIITVYVQAKENLSREIGELTAELFLQGMEYEEALERARGILGEEGSEKR